jgi:signal transduction histidine kinase
MDESPRRPNASVLVVDDTPANLQMLTDMLRARGYRARPVPNGKLAIQAAKADPPDLILLDINMPMMDGFAVCVELKHDTQLASIPVIFISAYGETLDKIRAFSVGGVDYITKPFQIEEVEARVATHLELRFKQHTLEEAMRRQRELENMRDSLVHMIVHDLRAPLTAVFNYLDLVREQEVGLISPEGVENLDLAMKATRWMVQMVTMILDTSKFESGQMRLHVEPCDVVEVLTNAIDGVRSLAAECNLFFDPEPVHATLDPTIVSRILQNLLSNAIKLTPSGGNVRVSLRNKGDFLHIYVEDEGPGIAPEHHPLVFEKYAQLNAGIRQSIASSGLGLYFCKLAVQAHGGEIGVDSDLGRGSTFWFSLPLRPTVSAQTGLPRT